MESDEQRTERTTAQQEVSRSRNFLTVAYSDVEFRNTLFRLAEAKCREYRLAEDAQEIVQEVITRVLVGIHSKDLRFDDQHHAYAYLYERIAKLPIDYARHNQVTRKLIQDGLPLDHGLCADKAPTRLEEMLEDERLGLAAERLRRLNECLTPTQQAVLIRLLEGHLSKGQIAISLGFGPSTLTYHLKEIKKKAATFLKVIDKGTKE